MTGYLLYASTSYGIGISSEPQHLNYPHFTIDKTKHREVKSLPRVIKYHTWVLRFNTRTICSHEIIAQTTKMGSVKNWNDNIRAKAWERNRYCHGRKIYYITDKVKYKTNLLCSCAKIRSCATRYLCCVRIHHCYLWACFLTKCRDSKCKGYRLWESEPSPKADLKCTRRQHGMKQMWNKPEKLLWSSESINH